MHPHASIHTRPPTPKRTHSGTLCVDTFLLISGFLATYLLMAKLDKDPYRPTKCVGCVGRVGR